MLLAFKTEGYDVLAVAPDDHPEVGDELKTLGIEYKPVKLSRTGFNPLLDFVFLVSLYRIIKDYRPDVIIPYTVKPVIYGSLAASVLSGIQVFPMITGLGYLETEGGGSKKRFVKKIMLWLYKLSLKKIAGILFQNEDDAAYFKKRKLIGKGIPVKVISGSGINIVQFKKVAPVISPVRFLLVARLLKSKGVQLYIDAATSLKKRYPHAEFHLIGQFDDHNPDGIDKKWLNESVEKKFIVFHGFQNDIRTILAASSVFVLPSYYREGVPRTILEAMAMAKPVITTDNTGCRETVKDQSNGFLIPVRSLQPLVNAMEHFIQKPESIERMGNESYNMVLRRFDVHIVNDHILTFVKEHR